MPDYAAIIIGGGIAGLSLGSELSKSHKILLLEKDVIGKTHKSWTTEKKIAKKAGILDYATLEFDKCFIKFFDSEKHFVYDKLVSFDDEKILRHFKRLIKDNGSDIKEHCAFRSIIERKDGFVKIKTDKGNFSTKLLIDCSGYKSKLTKRFDVFDKIYYFTVYGGIYNKTLKEDEYRFGGAIFKRFPVPFFEVFPLSKKSFVLYTFEFVNYRKNPFRLKNVHEENVRQGYLSKRLSGVKKAKDIYGIIPMGRMKKHAVDNIFFFGDTSLIGAPFGGTGFTTILQHYKKFSKHISKNIKAGTLTEKDLVYNFSEEELLNRDLEVITGMFLVNAKPQDLYLIFELLKGLSQKQFWDFVFLRLSLKDVLHIIGKIISSFGVERLMEILPKKEYLFLMKQGSRVFEDIIVEEEEELFHKHHESI